MNCMNCGGTILKDDVFCPNCGAKTQQSTVSASDSYCPDCGAKISAHDAFCPNCSKRLETASPAPAGHTPYTTKTPSQNNSVIILAVVAAVIALISLIFALVTIFGDFSPTPTQKHYAAPLFPDIWASSTRGYDIDGDTNAIVYYYPYYATDGNITTAWTPNRSTDTVPTLTLSADTKQHVSGIRMTNGYCKSQKTYTRNRRITKVLISYEGGEFTTTFGIDNYRVLIDIPFDEPVDTSYISITVLDSYYGDWKDVAISEIEVY